MTMQETSTPDLLAGLQDDPSGQRCAALIARLRGLHEDCLARKRTLCDRKTYELLEASSTALAAAIRIIEAVSHRRHGGN
ncbi:MAG: hypothetical protein H7238_12475 [Polaromonas sp.]|nr:hypothetical protein [Polaromonas sp.]